MNSDFNPEPRWILWLLLAGILFLLALIAVVKGVTKGVLEYSRIEHYGCTITQESPQQWWYVRFWADYRLGPSGSLESPPSASQTPSTTSPDTKKHDWESLYAVEEKRERALTECNLWIRTVEKRLKQLQHQPRHSNHKIKK